MKKKILGIVLSFSMILVTGCSKIPTLENGEEVIAEVDGLQITVNDLYDKVKLEYGTSVLINMIDDFIANQEVNSNDEAEEYADSQVSQLKLQYELAGVDFNSTLVTWGFSSEDDLVAYFISSYKKSSVVENYVKEHLTDDEINEYYDNEIYGDMTVRYILVDPDVTSDMTDDEKTAAEEEALALAKDIIKQLNNGADFSELAIKYSDDEATAKNGGLYSDFNKTGDNAPESAFFEAALALEDGKYTLEPIKTSYGYNIILKVSQKDKPELELVQDTIVDALYKEKSDEDEDLSDKTWAKVREKYNLNIVDTEIKNIYDTTISQLK
ncbi:MAG: peptidylprolyl isomerase [Bacilli bacterium]|nr:peptidylprolyl isomerase [Bacilli bacterium]